MARFVKSYSVPCPTCGAKEGDPCTVWRARAHYTHVPRKRAVAAAEVSR